METFEELMEFAAAQACVSDVPPEVLRSWLIEFAAVTEPTVVISANMVTLQSGGGGVSRKPGNILLNWRRLFDVGPDVGIAAAAFATGGPYARSLICLYVWNKVWRSSEDHLSDAEASIIETLWSLRGPAKSAPSADVLVALNERRQAVGLAVLNSAQYERSVDRLVKMRCIEIDEGNLWAREWVRRKT